MIIYTSKTCGKCPTVKKFLKLKNIPFEERDTANQEYLEEATKYGNILPVVVQGDRYVLGGNLSGIMELV
ncbi:glutaredoxin family protein [Candidatus Saccharibacteria bacterium]|nr:glutaredoxin family protein [Candidatus Saccharibacteria bacterium]